MDAEFLVTALVHLQLAASAAILVVLLLRPLALRWFGAGTAYWLWLVVPLAAIAALLPAREQVVAIPMVLDVPILQQHVEPDVFVGIAREHAATPPEGQPGIPGDRLRSGLLITLWLLGASVFLIRSIVNTRRLASSSSIGPALVGVFRPRLVLPQDFEARFNAEERTLILAHEEMHRVSRHTLVNALVEVARCASWFNPLAHLAAERLRADQELACDTAVIAAHPESRHAYAEALLKAQVAGVYLPMGCVWTSGTAGRLAERIARLSVQLPGRRRRFVGAASIVGIGISASYAAWAQQPPRIITVQQPNPESAAAVATETPALEVPGTVRAPATQAPGPSPTEDGPQGGLPLGQFSIGAFFGPRDVKKEPATPAINGGSATPDENTLRRLAVVVGLGNRDGTVDESMMQLMKDPDPRKAWRAAAENQKQKLKDPEYRKSLRTQARIAIKHDNRRLAQELGLSDDEAERLFDLMADDQIARAAEGGILGNYMDQQELQEARRISRDFDRREKESIKAILGDKYALWQAYRETVQAPSRVTFAGDQVTYVSTLLAQAGKPLTAAQNTALTTALIAEQQRQAQEWRTLPANPADQAQSIEEDNRRTLLDAIAPHVNADQLAVLREQIGRQAAVDTRLRNAFAMDAVIDDRPTVNGLPNGNLGKPVCRIVRDGIPLDSNGYPLSAPEGLLAQAQGCQPQQMQSQLPQ